MIAFAEAPKSLGEFAFAVLSESHDTMTFILVTKRVHGHETQLAHMPQPCCCVN